MTQILNLSGAQADTRKEEHFCVYCNSYVVFVNGKDAKGHPKPETKKVTK